MARLNQRTGVRKILERSIEWIQLLCSDVIKAVDDCDPLLKIGMISVCSLLTFTVSRDTVALSYHGCDRWEILRIFPDQRCAVTM